MRVLNMYRADATRCKEIWILLSWQTVTGRKEKHN